MLRPRYPRVLTVVVTALALCAAFSSGLTAISNAASLDPVFRFIKTTSDTSNASARSAVTAPAASIIVTSTVDSGPGTLRQALYDALGNDFILFDTAVFPPTSPVTIYLQSPLPDLHQGAITIDASAAGVVLDGSNMPSGYYRGLTITSDLNVIRGLQIVNMPWDGILIINASYNLVGGDRTVGTGPMGQGNLISGNGGHGVQVHQASRCNQFQGNFIGTDVSGTSAWPNAFSGIALQGAPGPNNTFIGGSSATLANVISGNGERGVSLRDGAWSNTIVGNTIGLDVSGTYALGNGWEGVGLFGGATGNRVGGSTAAERNVIGGNSKGVLVEGSSHNIVIGNYVGTDASGTYAVPNHGDGGICIYEGATENEVRGNLASGNARAGIYIYGSGTTSNTVAGNLVGVDASASVALGNGNYGVIIFNGAADNQIGGTDLQDRNVIAGNGWDGVRLHRASGNRVIGNYIGTNGGGDAAIPNGNRGVFVWEAEDNEIGGALPGEGNLISGNTYQGIDLRAKTGYVIFPDINGLSPEYTGVFQSLDFPDSQGPFSHTDGSTPETSAGVPFLDYFAVRFTATAHVDVAGTYEFWLGSDDGSLLYIDGSKVIDRNYETGFGTSYGSVFLAAGNHPARVDYFENEGSAGLTLQHAGPGSLTWTADGTTLGLLGEFFTPPPDVRPSRRTRIVGNLIGTDVSGTGPLGNGDQGILIEDSDSTMIGGPTEAERNIITYNGLDGVDVVGSLAVSTTIQGNWIGVDADGTGGLDPRDLDVADDGTVFLADYGRGVVRSTDGTSTWEVITQGLTTLDIEQIAVAPNFTTTQRVWVWGDNSLFVSDDAGATWSSLGEVITGVLKALEVSPNYEVDSMLMAGLLWPNYEGMMGGVYRSTDGGTSWTRTGTSSAETIAFSPNFAADQTVLAGGYGLQRSTDGGDTWTQDTSGPLSLSISDLAFAADGQTVFLVSHHCGNDGVYISMDAGLTWVGSGAGLEDCGPEWQIALSPDFLTSGLALAAEDRVVRSTDGGATWSWSGSGVFGSRAGALAFGAPLSAYYANFNGVFMTSDGGSTWSWAAGALADRGNGGRGVEIRNGAGATSVISNVIARNANDGVSFSGSGPEGSLVEGNLVGVGPDGQTRAGNGGTGILLNTSYVTVTQNTIGGSGHGGIRSHDESVHHLAITDNKVGTDNTGMIAVGNSYDGISLISSWDTIRDNLVSGNWGNGILAAENSTAPHDSVIAGNWVGVDATGAQALPNRGDGLWVSGSRITVGGTAVDDRNIVSGNWGLGLRISGDDNLVIGNYIGTDVSGAQAVGYGLHGIYLDPRAERNQIGGDEVSERNLISGNRWQGIYARGSSNVIQGNYVGTDITGAQAVPNGGTGIYLGSYADHNTVGGLNTANDGTCTGDCNLVSGNLGGGIYIAGTGAVSNTVAGNFVGMASDGMAVLGNGAHGVFLGSGAQDNRIGGVGGAVGACGGTCNLIVGNGKVGVIVHGGSTVRNTIIQNSIYANGQLGIDLSSAGNTELPAPVIVAFDIAAGTASGTICADCVVEIFSDEHGEGQWFEGSTNADGAGNWSFVKGSAFHGPELTATATDAAGNTSEFGQDWPADPPPAPVIAVPVCGTTNQTTPMFQGLAQLGSTVSVGAGGPPLGVAVTNDENRWTVNTGIPLSDGDYVITATATTVWGTSPTSALSLTVDSVLCYDPVGVTFEQRGIVQHPRDILGCADPDHDLEVVLWPSEPVTVSVPVVATTDTAYVEVNSIRYDLADPDADGVATATFTAPDGGSFVILLAVSCGGDLQTLQIGSVIDPDGYVYDAEIMAGTGITQPVAGVTVTLYYSDTARFRWVIWDAALYGQVNPQVTGADGYFSFFTPPGLYKFTVDGTAVGYGSYESPVLTVIDEPIRNNVALSSSDRVYVYLPLVIRN